MVGQASERKQLSIACHAAALVSAFASGVLAADVTVEISGGAELRAFLENHCYECHGLDTQKAGLRLDTLRFDLKDAEAFDRWAKVYDKVSDDQMPPQKQPRPAESDRRAMLEGLERQLHDADRRRQTEQGRAVLRRLNRVEYENTLRDLLALPHLKIAQMLPEDMSAAGFDKVGAGLNLSSVHLRRYLEAADAAIEAAFARHDPPPRQTVRLSYLDEPSLRQSDYPVIRRDNDVVMLSRELMTFKPALSAFAAPFAGDYRIRVTAQGWQTDKNVPVAIVAGQGFIRTRITDTHVLGYFDAPPDEPRVIETVGRLEKEDYVRVFPPSFIKIRFAKIRQELKHEYDGPGLAVKQVEIDGPLIDQWPPKSHRVLFAGVPRIEVPQAPQPQPNALTTQEAEEDRGPSRRGRWGRRRAPQTPVGPKFTVVSDQPVEDARRLLTQFTPAAMRRPVTNEQVEPYVELFRHWLDRGADFEQAMRLAYQAVLTSTDFLFFHEPPGELDDYAIAARLSYFLWNSMPDDRLLELAAQGALHEPATRAAQVERLLNDPKAQRFISDFVGQWLGMHQIEFTTPDEDLYPEFEKLLQDSMVLETQMFFEEVLRRDLSVANLIDSDFSILNSRLAEHYGIEGVEGVAMRWVQLSPDSVRGGVLTHGSILKVSANGTTTSPVLRGVWILDRLLGMPPDPPPANVPAIEPDIRGAVTIRDQLARHREDKSCAACHDLIDPVGFALESFDVIGGWRENYRTLEVGRPVNFRVGILFNTLYSKYRIGPPIEAGDQMPGGRQFDDVGQFKQILLQDKDQIARAVATRLLTYATGAAPSFADRRLIEQIVAENRDRDYGLRSLVHQVVASEAFITK